MLFFILLLFIPVSTAHGEENISLMNEIKQLRQAIENSVNQNTILISISLSVATGSLVFLAFQVRYLVKQSKLTEDQTKSAKTQTDILTQEFNSKHRPWIGVTRFTKNSSGKWYATYKNFGNLPSKPIHVKTLASNTVISRKFVEENAKDITKSQGIVFPEQTKDLLLTGLLDNHVKSAELGQEQLFIAFILEYELDLKQIGVFGSIWEYHKDVNNFAVIEQWTDES